MRKLLQTDDGWGGEHPPLILIFGMMRGGAMNYAVPTGKVFATRNAVKIKVGLSKEARSIRKFCATHTVKVYDNSQTGEIVVKVASDSAISAAFLWE